MAFLACPGMMQATDEGSSNIIAQREPHMDSPQDLADDYGNTTNFQTDGPIWSGAYTWSISRNYTWGDGHQVFIYRKNRAFSTSDSY